MPTVTFGAFEWDSEKAAKNVLRHGVTFEEASTALEAEHVIEKSDALHPERVLTIGFSATARILTVVSTEVVSGRVRIISARPATPAEQREFAQG